MVDSFKKMCKETNNYQGTGTYNRFIEETSSEISITNTSINDHNPLVDTCRDEERSSLPRAINLEDFNCNVHHKKNYYNLIENTVSSLNVSQVNVKCEIRKEKQEQQQQQENQQQQQQSEKIKYSQKTSTDCSQQIFHWRASIKSDDQLIAGSKLFNESNDIFTNANTNFSICSSKNTYNNTTESSLKFTESVNVTNSPKSNNGVLNRMKREKNPISPTKQSSVNLPTNICGNDDKSCYKNLKKDFTPLEKDRGSEVYKMDLNKKIEEMQHKFMDHITFLSNPNNKSLDGKVLRCSTTPGTRDKNTQVGINNCQFLKEKLNELASFKSTPILVTDDGSDISKNGLSSEILVAQSNMNTNNNNNNNNSLNFNEKFYQNGNNNLIRNPLRVLNDKSKSMCNEKLSQNENYIDSPPPQLIVNSSALAEKVCDSWMDQKDFSNSRRLSSQDQETAMSDLLVSDSCRSCCLNNCTAHSGCINGFDQKNNKVPSLKVDSEELLRKSKCIKDWNFSINPIECYYPEIRETDIFNMLEVNHKIKKIGTGNYTKATLYLLKKKITDEKLVLKTVSLNSAPMNVKIHAKEEANAVRFVSHPNLCQTHLYVNLRNNLYICMDYYGNKTLNDELFDCSYLEGTNLDTIFAQLVCGLFYLHKKGIIHRDLKPDNIMIQTNFGFAKLMNGETTCRIFCGTRSYKSPQIRQAIPYNPYDSDRWSLGVVLAKMCTGKTIFKNLSCNEILFHLKRNFVKFIENQSDNFVPSDVIEVITGTVREIPSQRMKLKEIAQCKWFQSSDACKNVLTRPENYSILETDN